MLQRLVNIVACILVALVGLGCGDVLHLEAQ